MSTLREFESAADYQACVELQKLTWGENFTECVPPIIQMVGQKIGGVSAGAFDDSGKLIGFVFGLTGVKNSAIVHWSDMLAVRPEFRDKGLGIKLKHFQRELCLKNGVEVVYWTYDPLESRNANFNLNKLGVEIDEYVPNMYESSGGALHAGLSMDRCIVAWHIAEDRFEKTLTARRSYSENLLNQAPVINGSNVENDEFLPGELLDSTSETIRIEIPEDVQKLKQKSMTAAKAWRKSTRAAFEKYMEAGYQITAFYRDAQARRCFYFLHCKI